MKPDVGQVGSPVGGSQRQERRSSLSILARVFALAKPHALGYVAGILGVGLANLLINVLLARMLMSLTGGIMEISRDKVASGTRLLAIGTVLMAVFVLFSGRTLLASVYGVANDIRKRLLSKFLHMPFQEVESRHSGDLLARATTSLRQVERLLLGDFQTLANTLLSGVGSAIYMVTLDPGMGLVGIGCGVLPLITNLPFAGILRRTGKEVEETQAALVERVSDVLQGRDTIRHLNLGKFISSRTDWAGQQALRAGLKQVGVDTLRMLADGASDLVMAAYGVYVSYVGIRNPDLIPVSIAMMQLSFPVKRLFATIGAVVAEIQINISGAERVLEVLDIAHEPVVYERATREPVAYGHATREPVVYDYAAREPVAQDYVSQEHETFERPDAPSPAGCFGTVEDSAPLPALAVEGLSFMYSTSQAPAISDVSFAVMPGETVALVGPSGGGKSTLVRLVLGLYPPASGEIRVKGACISQVPLRDWRRFFSYVPQDSFLFAGTVYDNIAAEDEGAAPSQVESAARAAGIHDFIAGLSGGYQTPIVERGASLSGGQKQRIAIARAIRRNAPILLLDEATASLDTESEALVQEALDNLMADRTVLVVAHRLSTVRRADQILLLDGGSIVERGSHDELMAAGGRYKDLVDAGFGRQGRSR